MNTPDQTIIELSKMKYMLYAIGSCVFVAIGIWMLSLDAALFSGQRYAFAFVRGLGIASIAFFGIGGVILTKRFLDTKQALIFNATGIVDNTGGVSTGRQIPWSEIISAKTLMFGGDTYLLIEVTNPQKYLYRKNAAKQLVVNANYNMFGSPIIIAGIGLDASIPELLSLFNKYQQRYGVIKSNTP